MSAKRIVLGLPYDVVQHRTVRFAVIIPVALIQLLLGTHPNVYYVAPLLLSAIHIPLVYALAHRLSGRPAAFMASFFLALFPYMIRGGSQVRPGVFSVAYILASTILLLRYMTPPDGESPRRRTVDLLASSLLLFVAYQTKITNLYFLPGYVVVILLFGRGRRDALVFGALLLGLFLVETALFYRLFGASRLQIIMGNHLEGYTEPMRFWGLFRRYAPETFPFYWAAVLILWVPAAVLLWCRRRDRTVAALSVLVLSFVVGITFAVSSVDPVSPVEPFHHRYFLAILAPVLIIDAMFLVEAGRRAAERWGRRLPVLSPAAGSGFLLAVVLLIAGAFSLGIAPSALSLYFNDPLRPDRHPLALNSRYLGTVTDAWEAGLPIVGDDSTGGWNAVNTATHYFLPDEVLLSGGLPIPARQTAAGRPVVVLVRGDGHPPALRPEDPVLVATRNPFDLMPARVSELPAALGAQ